MEPTVNSKEAVNIFICHDSDTTPNLLLEQIRYGIEEERMPSRAVDKVGSSAELARDAAQLSLLGIGVGLDRQGVITLTQHQMPSGQYVMQVPSNGSLAIARIMGNNAARLYKRYPFVDWKSEEATVMY